MKKIILLLVLGCALIHKDCKAFGGPFSSWSKAGDMTLVMAPAYALGITLVAHDYKGTLQLVESVAAGQIASEGIKALKLEERPNGADKKSLPSGHAAGAFSAAMFVHKRYGLRYAITPYVLSLFTGYSRVRARAHYWHDVAAGAAVSALFTWILVDKYLPTGTSVSVEPGAVHLGFNTQF